MQNYGCEHLLKISITIDSINTMFIERERERTSKRESENDRERSRIIEMGGK